MHYSAQANADAQQDEEASAIPLDSMKTDRKGKGRAIPEGEEEDITNNIANYDLSLEQEQEQERLEQERAQHQRYNGEYIDLANDENAGNDVPGEYPPMGDDEMEERRVQEVRLSHTRLRCSMAHNQPVLKPLPIANVDTPMPRLSLL
jgi:hypothetical protein